MKWLLRFLTVFFLLCPINVFPQKIGQPRIDSLLLELPKAKEDSNKVKLLNEVSLAYYSINPDEGIKYGNEGLKLAEKLQWKAGMAMLNGVLGINYSFGKSDFPVAISYYVKSLNIYKEIGNKKGISVSYGNIGSIYTSQSNYPKALEYYFMALSIKDELNDKEGIANTLQNIGCIYEYEEKYDKALDYCFKSLKIDQSIGDKFNIAQGMSNIGLIYMSLKNYKKARDFEDTSLSISEEIGDDEEVAAKLACIGTIYFDQNDYSKTLSYYFKALKTLEKMDRKDYLVSDLGNIGQCYLAIATDTTDAIKTDSLIPAGKTANLHKAIEYLKRGIGLSREIGDLQNMQIIAKSLSEAQALSGDYKESLENYKQFVAIKDSIYNIQNNVKITNLETKRDIDLKEKQIEIDSLEIIKKRNERSFFIAVIFLLMVIGISFINSQRLKRKKLEAEMKHAESELEASSKLLDSFRQSVQEKNVIIEHFSNEIERMKEGAEQQEDNELRSKLESSIILTDQQWEEFRILFEKVHKGFFGSLKKKMPDLSQAEIRFLALTKLKLSSKEMASMLGISTNAIRIYRHRLRRKLDLDKEDMIEELVEGI